MVDNDHLPWQVVVDGEGSVHEAQEANNGRGDEHVRVEAEPCKVQSYLDTEILLDVVQGLVSVNRRN